MYVYMFVSMCACMFVCVYVCIYMIYMVYIYIYIYIYIYVYIYMHAVCVCVLVFVCVACLQMGSMVVERTRRRFTTFHLFGVITVLTQYHLFVLYSFFFSIFY
jgi:hypothetical protein